jgi:HD-like signal output (HDOD) protein
VPASATSLSVQERALRALSYLPPFSPILNRVIASLARQDVSFAAISGLIEKDTVLAGNLLKLVNSALYQRAFTITSVRHAVSLLGVNKLRNATLGMSVARMWNQVKTPPGWSMASFNLHSAGTAILSDLLVQKLPVEYAEGAFAAGLFHDLGWLLVALSCPDEFKQLTTNPTPASELEILGISHAELSAQALAAWNLPEAIQNAVRFHVNPEKDPGSSADTIPLSRILSVADQCVRSMGSSIAPIENDGEIPVDPADSVSQSLAQVLPEFEAEFSNIQQFF